MFAQRSLPPAAAVRSLVLRALPALLIAVSTRPAAAASLPPLEARQMVAQSPVIVHATVVSSHGRWNDDRSLVVTETRLRVHEAVKGGAAGEIRVLVPGGTLGKLQVDVPGATPFQPGTETVVFLVRDARGNQYVHGLSRGRFDVQVDAATGRKTVPGLSPVLAQALAEDSPAAKSAPTGAGAGLDAVLAGLRTLVRDVDAKGGR